MMRNKISLKLSWYKS